MQTLELFGLPNDYINGNGHHVDWGKNKGEDKKKKGAKRTDEKSVDFALVVSIKERGGIFFPSSLFLCV